MEGIQNSRPKQNKLPCGALFPSSSRPEFCWIPRGRIPSPLLPDLITVEERAIADKLGASLGERWWPNLKLAAVPRICDGTRPPSVLPGVPPAPTSSSFPAEAGGLKCFFPSPIPPMRPPPRPHRCASVARQRLVVAAVWRRRFAPSGCRSRTDAIASVAPDRPQVSAITCVLGGALSALARRKKTLGLRGL